MIDQYRLTHNKLDEYNSFVNSSNSSTLKGKFKKEQDFGTKLTSDFYQKFLKKKMK